MERRRVAVSTMLAIAASMSTLSTTARAQPQAVIELFTSQGCSSCPPADRLLGELARNPALVALSLPIDYWDYLGWKDTLAEPRHSARQRGYAHVRGDRDVYTPQAVVNGAVHVLGSDQAAIEQAINQTSHQGATLSLPVELTQSDGKLAVTVKPGAAEGSTGEVWLCAIARKVAVEIGRGENTGHTVTYHNVVRRWLKLGDWTGTAHTFTIATSEFEGDGVDAVAVLIQAGTVENPRTLLGGALETIR